MKILFVENRYIALMWVALAQSLEKRGHEIYWIVQNPMFGPKVMIEDFKTNSNPLLDNFEFNFLTDGKEKVDRRHAPRFSQQLRAGC